MAIINNNFSQKSKSPYVVTPAFNSDIQIDEYLNPDSSNPVQNKTITQRINDIAAMINNNQNVDAELDPYSTHAIQNKAVYNKFSEIENSITEFNEKIANISLSGYLSDKEGYDGVKLSNLETIVDVVIKLANAFGWNNLSA